MCEHNLTSTTIRKQLYSLQYYPNKDKASTFCDKFEDLVRTYGNLSGVEPLSESEKRDMFFSCVMTTVPEVQSVEFMTKSSTGNSLSYEQLKMFILQAEANKNQNAVPETRAAMQAHTRNAKDRCYECHDNSHIAKDCPFKGTGWKKCYGYGQVTDHISTGCPLKRLGQSKSRIGRGRGRSFSRGNYRSDNFRQQAR